ncbi:hypothetical protein HA466_0176380 [Hirschfeldia incana]|nr:hypothetical protein HA466_0176380 [Hirschfeldia incana]
MSLFFSRISKSSAYKVKNARFFSSLPESPYLLLSSEKSGETCDGSKTVRQKLFDPRTEEPVNGVEKTLPKELERSALVGASQGWILSMDRKDSSLHLTDLWKPWVSSSPRVMSLPSLGFDPCVTVKRVSLSSSSPDECTIAANFSESQLSVCRTNCDSSWTHFKTPFPLLKASDLMFSKRDNAFYFASDKGPYMGSFHLSSNKLKYEELRFGSLPKFPEAEWQMLDAFYMSKHFVESPSGELFFVKWYRQFLHKENNNNGRRDVEAIHTQTRRFMVFRQDYKTKAFFYTQDIGDLCIFLGKSEGFCLSATMYPGLKPNSIYYIGPGLASYHLPSGTVRPYNPPGSPKNLLAPFWLDPISS